MLKYYTSNWWVFLVRGLCALILGIIALATPGIAFLSFVLVWGAFAVVDGAFALFAALRGDPAIQHRAFLALEGVVGIIAGIIALWNPGIAMVAIDIVIAAWCLVIGFAQIGAAFRLRQEWAGEIFLILSGLLTIIAGILLMMYPLSSMEALIWVAGVFAIAYGVLQIVLSFRLKGMQGTNLARTGH